MRGFRFLFAAVVLLVGAAVQAAEFQLPGLERDASAYQRGLQARSPAGGTPAARKAAELKADEAEKKRDWAAAALAWEARIALGDATPAQWLSLAQAQMRRVPPDAARGLQAAWQNFAAANEGPAEVPALLLMADALKLLNRPAQAVQTLEAAVERAPNDARIKQLLADTRRAAGMLVSRVTTEPEADPARACIGFSVAPRAEDFIPQDWVRLDPPVPGAAVTREGNLLCVSGLPNGETTRILLRGGMPAAGGLTLVRNTEVPVAMGNRQPRILFDQRMFVMPRGQTPTITMSTVNLSSVKLTLARLTERNIVAFIRENRLGEEVDRYAASNIGDTTGRIVWEGSAEIPRWQANRIQRTALPVPDALAKAGPGVYALIVQPGDGTRGSATGVQMIIRTDLAPTVWRGTDGLNVQMRGYSDALPRSGVRLQLLATNNDILAEVTTDADGVARFAKPLLRGEGPLEPRAIHAFGPGDDFVSLDLNAPAFDLSDRGVAGQAHPGPLDSFVWLDRGIYRPGETVQVMALLRDAGGAPADFPARLTVRRPNGQVFQETTPTRGAEASIHLPVVLSTSAPTGTWVVEVRSDPAGPPIGRTEFRVDAFVPDRMAVELGPVPGPLVAGQPYALPVLARFLYGAPAAGLSGTGNWRLTVDEAPFPALAGYRIGLVGETYAPSSKEVELSDTDAEGKTRFAIDLPRLPDTTRALKAEIDVTINDPGGRGSRATVSVPVRPAGRLIGIKPLFDGGAVDADAEAGFDIAAVDPDGKRVALGGKLRLVRERPDWRLVLNGNVARYQIVWRDEPLETQDISVTADAPARFTKKLGFGRYRLEVTEANGMAATSVRFRAGWVSAGSPDVPDQVDVSTAQAVHAPGETAKIHIAPPFSGPATLMVLTDRVMMLRNITVAEGGTDVEVPVSADWGPGAYIAVHAFRAGGEPQTTRPGRAIGLVWVGIDPATRKLELSLDTPEKFPPRARAIVPVRGTPGAWVSLAAVDEGILRLTNFQSPDPAPHFLGRRRLGLDIRDDWGRLIPPGEGEATVLSQGGDDGSFVLPDTPIRTVTLFTPPVQIGADGKVEIPLEMPDFAGQVRLMAVGWSGARIGAASTKVLVRDPLVAEPLLPRFLAPGDETRFAVLMQNLELSPGDVSATVSVDGPLALSGPARLAARLEKGQQAVPVTQIKATGAGRGVIRMDVRGPDGFQVQREVAITVRPSRGRATIIAGSELAPNAEARLSPGGDRFLAGTWRAQMSVGGPVRYDVPALVRLLDDYPLRCLEQATSRGLPLALLPDGPLAGPDRAANLQQSVAQVLDRQRFDGAFGLWSASGEAQDWLSPYATDFLLRAKAAGAAVPEQALRDALKYLSDQADSPGTDAQGMANQAYRLYVLARVGKGRPGAARVLAENLDALPTPLARAQIGAALALARDRGRAENAFRAALDAPARKFWFGDYGSALRDQMAVALLLKESGLLPDRLAKLTGTMPGNDLIPAQLSTQEQAWAIAVAAVLGRDGRPVRVSLNGDALPAAPALSLALAGPAVLRNLDDRAVWQAVSVSGVPATPLPAARNLMSIRRQFLAMDGKPLNLDTLRQNTVFVLLLEGKAEDGQEHTAQLLHGLPAGWEIAGRFSEGDVPGLPWLGKLTATDAQPGADDRFAAVLTLPANIAGFRIAVKLRAVTPGNFELPGAELSDMYRPGIFARQNAGRVNVAPVE